MAMEQSGGTKTIYEIAQDIQKKADENAKSRNEGSLNNLKANAKQGQYTNSGQGHELQDTFCNINKNYSNASRPSNNPCKEKDTKVDRFSVGTTWRTDQHVKVGHQGVYLPPRRRGMCTTNLENLDVKSSGGPLSGGRSHKDGKLVSDSFLGDVLLSAKEEGKEIAKHITDTTQVCRAMKYSFADLGDIIRGRDLWSKHSGSQNIETRLQTIFGNIKNKHNEIRGKYDDDDSTNHTKLREDWWAVNREHVWKAMTCEAPEQADLYVYTSSGKKKFEGKCGHNENPQFVPPDDYIPQGLRWMNEWAESYCRQVKSLYEGVTTACAQCKNGGTNKQCTRDSIYCTSCSSKCTEYKEHVKKWKKQWKTIKVQYQTLYDSTSTSRGSSDDPIQDQLDKFFEKLKGNKENNYKNLEDFIESMKGYMYCKDAEQIKYKGEDKNDPQYLFNRYPNNYDKECKCKEEPCDIVETIIKDKDGEATIENCKPKEEAKWECEGKVDISEVGACMPPRRQKLCIHNLKELTDKTPDGLRKAFIQCAAIETFFAWKKYKEDHSGGADELDKKLKIGTITPEFKRIMYYTFGDFRDFVFGTDISQKDGNDDVSKVRKNIDDVFQDDGKTFSGQSPQEWWEKNGPDIWKGMLCGLSYHIKDEGDEDKEEEMKKELTDKEDYQYKGYDPQGINSGIDLQLGLFESTPQFLRWFTELADEFCKKQKALKEKLEKMCQDYTCQNQNDDKHVCKQSCKTYKDLIEEWKPQYEQQSKKYDGDKTSNKYKGTDAEDDVDKAKYAREYLDTKLKDLGVNDSCMKDASKKTQPSGSIPKSLDDYPNVY
ncbi:erythrocyte membrane protein 1, PfEMP1,putative [Plasmodium sp.]|nr:erythrocyte membrane protein 1, PfEMP1,putative [Plasmodium sp.]